MKLTIADTDGVKNEVEVEGVRITLPSGAVFDISVSFLEANDDCLRISAKQPGHIYTVCVVPENISTVKVKPLVIDK